MFYKQVAIGGANVGTVELRRRFDVARVSVTQAGIEIGDGYKFVVNPISNNGWELGVITPSGYIQLAEYYDNGYVLVNGAYKAGKLTFSSHKTNVTFTGRAKKGELKGEVAIESRMFPTVTARVSLKHPAYVPAPKVKKYV